MYLLSLFLAISLISTVQAVLPVNVPACCINTVPTSTATLPVTVTVSATVSVTTGTASTSYIFLPGSSPTAVAVPRARRELGRDGHLESTLEKRGSCNADNCLRALRGHTAAPFCATYTTATNTATTGLPTYIPTECNPSRISSACSCLSSTSTTLTSLISTTTISSTTMIPSTSTTSTTSTTSLCTTTTSTSCICPAPPIPTITVTSTVTNTATVTVSSPPSISTVYPCASPLPSPGPAYGDYTDTYDLGLQNSLYYLNTPEGASASACCNACLFQIPNCVQAYFYFYEGCVVSQATQLNQGSGMGISSTCPVGTFNGLSYGPDADPAFRSTGNIIGPCGQEYTNL